MTGWGVRGLINIDACQAPSAADIARARLVPVAALLVLGVSFLALAGVWLGRDFYADVALGDVLGLSRAIGAQMEFNFVCVLVAQAIALGAALASIVLGDLAPITGRGHLLAYLLCREQPQLAAYEASVASSGRKLIWSELSAMRRWSRAREFVASPM